MSKSSYKKYKQELIKKGYLLVVRTSANNGIINYYFGKNAVEKYCKNPSKTNRKRCKQFKNKNIKPRGITPHHPHP